MKFEGMNETVSNDQEHIGKAVKKIQDLYIGSSEKFFKEDDPTKKHIIDYYSDTERLTKELAVVFAGLTEEQIDQKIRTVSELFQDPAVFIEHNQKIHERIDSFTRTKKREEENPIATDEEYELGTYKEAIEVQVRDAVFMMQRKGYKTFQSGFQEKNITLDDNTDAKETQQQFVDMYNKKVTVPEKLIDSLKKEGFEISVTHHDDRTTIAIDPLSDEPVTLEQWKEVWDRFAAGLPQAESEDFSTNKRYTLHSDFRRKQDDLKK